MLKISIILFLKTFQFKFNFLKYKLGPFYINCYKFLGKVLLHISVNLPKNDFSGAGETVIFGPRTGEWFRRETRLQEDSR